MVAVKQYVDINWLEFGLDLIAFSLVHNERPISIFLICKSIRRQIFFDGHGLKYKYI
jgi:hypothetical protein